MKLSKISKNVKERYNIKFANIIRNGNNDSTNEGTLIITTKDDNQHYIDVVNIYSRESLENQLRDYFLQKKLEKLGSFFNI